jgi:hypothetical protein
MTALSTQVVPRSKGTPTRISLSAPTERSAQIAEATARAAGAHFSLPAAELVRELTSPRDRSLEEQLFDARAVCKIETRKFAMLFDPDWHTRLFNQLDMLMDVAEWDPADTPVTKDSFATLLRLLIILRKKRRPGLGIANGGNILASWSIDARDRLTIECRPNDRVRWVVTVPLDDGSESSIEETNLDHLLDRLATYNPDHWFAHEGPKPA